MTGLPRASTAKQFKKLMKKSGKSRTNKSSGGSDPSSHKIATYEQFCKLQEQIKWYSKGELSPMEGQVKIKIPTGFERHDKVIFNKKGSKYDGLMAEYEGTLRKGRSSIRLISHYNDHGIRLVTDDIYLIKLEEINDTWELEEGDEIYAQKGELFGRIISNDDSLTVMTTRGSKFIVPRDKFLTYEFLKRSE
jgi:hypothetical protein